MKLEKRWKKVNNNLDTVNNWSGDETRKKVERKSIIIWTL